jgi:nicotinamidase-related amidase
MSDAIFPKKERSALIVVDIQERLLGAMEPDAVDQFVKQNRLLVEMAGDAGWDIIYSEQYPKGLGSTEESIKELLEKHGATRVEKTEFSCCQNGTFLETVLPQLPSHIVVTGMETHVCVLQTVADLQARGHQVFVPHDAVLSRTLGNKRNGLQLMQEVGAVETNAETLVFYLLEKAGGEQFKKFSKMMK